MTVIRIKRVYEKPVATDGYRILVDRVWPRGVSKDKARLDDWCKDVAPSTELRTWFGHTPERYPAFREKYQQELHDSESFVELRKKVAQHRVVTLLYGTKDTEHNQAVVLQAMLAM